MKSGIYLITCDRPGKLPLYYVGQAQKIRQRWNEHRLDLRKNAHRNGYMQSAWGKYGAESFSIELIEPVPAEHLDAAEQWWLDEMHGHARCMNIAKDATVPNRGMTTSDATKEKISAANKGAKRTEEQRQRMREGCIGRVVTEQTRAKMSDTHKNRESHWTPELRERLRQANLGKAIPPEHRAKMSAAKKGMKPTVEALRILAENSMKKATPVVATCIKTGVTLTFPSIGSTAQAGFSAQCVWGVVAGKHKTHKGHYWTRATSTDEPPPQTRSEPQLAFDLQPS